MFSDLWSKNFPTNRGKIRSKIKEKNKEQVVPGKCLLTEWETDVGQETEWRHKFQLQWRLFLRNH